MREPRVPSRAGGRPLRLGRLGRLRVLAVVVLFAACGCAHGSVEAAAVPGAAEASPAASASPLPAPRTRGRLVVHGTGDVNLDPAYVPALAAHGYDHAWSGLDGLFTTDDLTVVNLECPVSDRGAPVPKEFTFRCDPAALPAARAAGVDVANLANNHGGDRGPDALVDSVERVRGAGIAPVGAGANVRAATTPAIVERNGWRIAVLGFGGVVPAADWLAGRNRPGMANGDDVAAMTAAVRAAGEQADLVFVTVHWGVELDTRPRPEDVARAHALIDAGADGIFGHHAHRLQPLGFYRGRPIAWGLGNFVWPKMSEAGSRSAVAEFVVEPDGTVRGCLLPARIVSPGHPVLTGPRSCPS
jgi:poly-gamma-glutamate capsule biosynthesis protein CapA/YwtB (metallophosphatase superfamily)